jgi:hypothetical protein
MAEKGMTFTIQNGNIRYYLPSISLNTAAIMSILGANDPAKVPLNVLISANVDGDTQALVDTSIGASGKLLVLTPVQIAIMAEYGVQTVEVPELRQYFNYTIEITKEHAKQVTTAVAVETDGSLRHVPTCVYEEGGKWYVMTNSLTNSVYALIRSEKTFADVAGKGYEAAVNEMGSRGIVSGVGNDMFAGGRDITRAEFAAITIRALGLPVSGGSVVFSDVPLSAWYNGAVGKAYEYGLVTGMGSRFAPSQYITRQEAMVIIWRAAIIMKYRGGTSDVDIFSDYKNISGWALDAAGFNVGSGLVIGSNGMLRPKDNITRVESALLVLRLLQMSGFIDERTPIA